MKRKIIASKSATKGQVAMEEGAASQADLGPRRSSRSRPAAKARERGGVTDPIKSDTAPKNKGKAKEPQAKVSLTTCKRVRIKAQPQYQDDADSSGHDKKRRKKAHRESKDIYSERRSTDGDVGSGMPRRRMKYASSLDVPAKTAVIFGLGHATGQANVLRCCLGGYDGDANVVQYAHLIPTSTHADIITKLEWSWGRSYDSLYLDSSCNVHPLYVALHALFDRTQRGQPTGWFWVMKDETLLRNMYQAYCLDGHAGMRLDPESFYMSAIKSFEYKVVGFPELESTASSHIFEVLKSGKTNLASGVLHQYPFDTLPYIKLHVRPHFVIYNTGEKMRRRFGPYIKADADNRRKFVDNQLGADMADHLLKMYDIYRAWISCDLPANKFEELEKPEKNLRQSAGLGPSTQSHAQRTSGDSKSTNPTPTWRQFYNLEQELAPEDSASLASFRVYCTSSGGLVDEDAMSDTSCRSVTDDGMEPLSDYVKRWRRGVPPGASDTMHTNEMPEQRLVEVV